MARDTIGIVHFINYQTKVSETICGLFVSQTVTGKGKTRQVSYDPSISSAGNEVTCPHCLKLKK